MSVCRITRYSVVVAWFVMVFLTTLPSVALAKDSAATVAQRHKVGALSRLTVDHTPEAAPDLHFLTPDGAPITLEDFKGKAVLVNIWATWCPPCLRELPSIDRLATRIKEEGLENQVAVVALNVDRGAPTRAAAFLKRKALNNILLYNDPSPAVMKTAGLRGMPTTLILDPAGREIARFEGETEWDAAEVVALLHALSQIKS